MATVLLLYLRDCKDRYGMELAFAQHTVDDFGHQQPSGVVFAIAGIIKKRLGYKYHWAVGIIWQRAASSYCFRG